MERKGPVRKEGVLARRLGEEWLLYDPQTGSVHVINAMAELVWRLCDGDHSTEDIAQHILATCEVPAGVDVRQDLGAILKSFSEQGVLQA